MDTVLFDKIIAAFDAYNEQDPNRVAVDGTLRSKELVYAERMTQRLETYYPQASVHLRLAARCQHIGRWEITRDEYPMDRTGYLKWRTVLKKHHAKVVTGILEQHGVEEKDRTQIINLILKANLKTDTESQILEDVVCLVFLEFYIEEFAEKHDDEKLIDILQKTMKKMSADGLAATGTIIFSDRVNELLAKASTTP